MLKCFRTTVDNCGFLTVQFSLFSIKRETQDALISFNNCKYHSILQSDCILTTTATTWPYDTRPDENAEFCKCFTKEKQCFFVHHGIRIQNEKPKGVKSLCRRYLCLFFVCGCVRGHMIGRCCRLLCLLTRGRGGGGGQSGVSSIRGVSLSRQPARQKDRQTGQLLCGVNSSLDFFEALLLKR